METKEMRLNFQGNHMPRPLFLERVKSDLLPFISIHTLQWNIFAMLVVEMIKNIYDHAEGVGYARFEKDTDAIIFEIRDYGKVPFKYDVMSATGQSTSAKEHNRGLGLAIISELAKQLKIELDIEQSKGLIYKGSWRYNR